MKKLRVAINGCGRIGRAFLRLALERPELEVVAVNDLASREGIEYLLKHDTVYGRTGLSLDGIKYLLEKEPSKLPWKELEVDVVVESTGFFTRAESAKAHIDAGAKRVVITAPIKDSDSPLIKGALPTSSARGARGEVPSPRGGGVGVAGGVFDDPHPKNQRPKISCGLKSFVARPRTYWSHQRKSLSACNLD